MDTKIIGKVTATENKPTTYNTLRFWLKNDEAIKIFDVVRIKHVNDSYTYAIVRDLQYITDSDGHLANYVSSDFGDVNAEPYNKRLGTTIAEAEVLYNSKDIEMPVKDGEIVETADNDGVRNALGLVGFEHPIPAGYLSMSYGAEVPIEFESDYLLGPEGAHLNISGISGLSTKTSYALFLLNSIQQRLGENVSMILFNVKGADLLTIDLPSKIKLTTEQQAEWEKCGLEPKPFTGVKYLYPYSSKREKNFFSATSLKFEYLKQQNDNGKLFNYYYDIETMKDKMYLLFSDVEDPNSTFESIFDEIRNIDVKSWDAFKSDIKDRTKSRIQKTGSSIQVQSWRKFHRFVTTRTGNAIFDQKSLIARPPRHQLLISDSVRGLKPGEILVIDIEQLPDYLQCLVVGDVVNIIRNIKLGEDEVVTPDTVGKVIIFADELNKYAPKSDVSGRSLTEILREITERGRSLGVILFGAEQFRSGVDDRILGNCSTNIFGRTSPVEMSKSPDYRYFPESHKATITRLEKGSLLLQHAIFKTHLIKTKFPFPCYHKEDVSK